MGKVVGTRGRRFALVIDGVEYQAVPRGGAMRGDAASRLQKARLHAGLTQVELAKRLGRSQALISKAERGKAQVGERYVQSVLAACQLKPKWGAPKLRATKGEDELLARDFAGLDPETLTLVVRGTKRDRELRKKYAWWANADVAW